MLAVCSDSPYPWGMVSCVFDFYEFVAMGTLEFQLHIAIGIYICRPFPTNRALEPLHQRYFAVQYKSSFDFVRITHNPIISPFCVTDW